MSGRKLIGKSYGLWGSRRLDGNAYGQLGLTAICAAGLFSVIYMMKGLYPFGDGSILITDLYSQYVPLLYRFYDVVAGAKNLFMDFSVSGGANLYVDTINEIINPFNYVLFLFGREEIYRSVNVVLMLYVLMSAVSADYFLLKIWPQKRDWNLVLSLCYAFSGYMAYNYQIIKWMYFPVLFPLFVLALLRLIREKKGILYALLLGYQLALSVQLGFMALLFVLFGSGFYFRLCVEKEDRPKAVCRLGLYTLAGVMLSAAVLIPNAAILFSSARAEENLSYLGVMKRHGLDDLFERLFQVAHPVLLALTAALTAGLLRRRMREMKERRSGQMPDCREGLPAQVKFLFLWNGFLWLTVLLQPANLLWHMGSYVCFPVRYAYMVLLCGICLIKSLLEAKSGWESAEKEPPGTLSLFGVSKSSLARSWVAWLTVVILCMMGFSVTLEWEDRIVQAFSSLAISSVCPAETGVVCLVLGLFLAAALCGMAAGKHQSTFAGLTAAFLGICFYVMIFLPADNGVRLENEAAYRKMALQAEESAGEDTLLVREKDEDDLPLNAALVNRRGSLSGYFPTASRQMKEAMEGLGYLTPWVSTRSVGGTTVSDELLRRILVFDTASGGLGLKGSSPLERQEELTVLTAGESLAERYRGSEIMGGEAGTLRLSVANRRTLWLDPGMTADHIRVWVNGTEIEIPEAFSAYSLHRIISLGAFAEEEVEIAVTDSGGAAVSAEEMELAVLDEGSFTERLEVLQQAGKMTEGSRELPESAITIDEVRGRIAAKLIAEEGETLFFPFAALDGWKCVRNGKTVDMKPVLGGFMGITLAEGENEISLTFTPAGLMPGLVLTLLAAAILLAAAVWDGICEPVWGMEKAAVFLYRIFWFGGLAAIYVVPAAGLAVYLVCKLTGIGG